MRIIEKGNKTYECPICGCKFMIDNNDIRFHIHQHFAIITNFYDREDYVNCPQCGFEMTIDRYDCNCVGDRI